MRFNWLITSVSLYPPKLVLRSLNWIINKRFSFSDCMSQKNYDFFIKKLILLFSKDAFIWSNKTFIIKKKIAFQWILLLFFLSFYSSKNPGFFLKTINIDNNQEYFLSYKSVYYYDFWRSCDTEDWRNDAENSALITRINLILQYTQTENSSLKL